MIWANALLLLLLGGASIALAMVEAAFYLAKRRRLSHVAMQNPRAELANRYLEDPPSLLMPMHMGTYTAHVGMTLVITSLAFDLLGHWSMLLSFGVMVGYLLSLRLTLPYAIVRRNPERWLLLLMPAFHVYAQALSPVVALLRKQGGVPDTTQVPDRAEQAPPPAPEVPPPPVLEPDEYRLAQELARFSETQVKEVMTPRPDVVAIAAASSVADLRRVLRESKYSRVPVFGDNLDDIVGVISVRDLVEYDGVPEDPVQALVRPVHLVPATKRLGDLLKEMQDRRLTFAVVIDEYGGTAGLVTMEDIVEELVGEIKDEYDVETDPISVEPDGAVLVAGRVNVDRLEQALEAALTAGERVGTVGGLVTSMFGRVPKPGEQADFKGFLVEVVAAEGKRVNRVRFRRKPVEAPGAE